MKLFNNLALAATCLSFSALTPVSAQEQQGEVIQTPPILDSEPINETPNPPAIEDSKQAPVQECHVKTVADVYTVTSLEECGQRLDNSYLRGALNRAFKRCADEKVVAHVYASTKTCESCASKTHVAQIRSQRGQACTCENPNYITALISDLASNSNSVRRASMRSLRLCGYRVSKDNECVDEQVPSIVLY